MRLVALFTEPSRAIRAVHRLLWPSSSPSSRYTTQRHDPTPSYLKPTQRQRRNLRWRRNRTQLADLVVPGARMPTNIDSSQWRRLPPPCATQRPGTDPATRRRVERGRTLEPRAAGFDYAGPGGHLLYEPSGGGAQDRPAARPNACLREQRDPNLGRRHCDFPRRVIDPDVPVQHSLYEVLGRGSSPRPAIPPNATRRPWGRPCRFALGGLATPS